VGKEEKGLCLLFYLLLFWRESFLSPGNGASAAAFLVASDKLKPRTSFRKGQEKAPMVRLGIARMQTLEKKLLRYKTD
jgi:hypothetical protein